MRITFVLPASDLSGGVKVVGVYAKALTQKGHSVSVVSPAQPTLSVRERLRSLLRQGLRKGSERSQSHLDDLPIDHRVLESWRRVNDRDVPDGDVVIATWWETAEWVNELSSTKGAKVYFVQHHEIFPYLPVQRCHATYRLPMHKIVVAKWLKDVMGTEYGDNQVDVVPNSVDHDQFFAPVRGKQSVPTIGLLYSTAAFKGLDISLEAIHTVHKHIPDLRVICFGSERPSRRYALPENSQFTFCPPQDELRNLYARCDVWITASRSEGFNLPAIEAMACRTPVVATKAGWPAEVVQTGKNGVLVDVDDVKGLAQGVEWVLSRSDGDWRSLSQRAYDASCSGSWEDSSRLFEAALIHACHRATNGEIAGKYGSAVTR
jgi:glycosyltransferase involved in cell wall biosynthesis